MIHLYWARRPVTAARAILFAQLVDDPSSRLSEFPTEVEQDAERMRLHKLMEELILWENGNNLEVLEAARAEIRKSNGGKLPGILDPFAGGGAIPLEAARLGLQTEGSDLNPLAVLINKGLSELPSKFKDQAPVFPGAAEAQHLWRGAEGLAEDVRQYGYWMLDKAKERIGHLYPQVTAPGGTKHQVIAWIWARTAKNPNPANPIMTPLVRSWWLSKKKGTQAYVVPTVKDGVLSYVVNNDSDGPKGDDEGTIGRRGATSVGDKSVLTLDYLRKEGQAGRLGQDLIAIVAAGEKGRIYLSPQDVQVEAANIPRPQGGPVGSIPENPRDFRTHLYGLGDWADLFTNRQLTALLTLTELVGEAREKAYSDAMAAGSAQGIPSNSLQDHSRQYADSVATYLGFAVSRQSNSTSSIAGWDSSLQKIRNVFSRQAIPMMWDYAEVNIFSTWSGGFSTQIDGMADAIKLLPSDVEAEITQANAATRSYSGAIVSTDPPYYDNIGYSDLSDYFYVWLRKSLGDIYADLLGTMFTPKAEELVANPYRHGGKEEAAQFFVSGFNDVFKRIRDTADLTAPMAVYYAYKQQETGEDGSSSTGWHTLLSGLIDSGWEITATWPLETEMTGRLTSSGANALASSIVLACRPRSKDAEATTRRAFLSSLRQELPYALRNLMQGAIAPVDLAQAAIGPGMAIYSRYSRILEPDGSNMSVRNALLLINGALDEVLNEQESDFDPETRFAVKWYRQFGWGEASAGIADQLARSTDTSLSSLERGGVFEAKGGIAKLLSPTQLTDQAWNPETDDHVSVWECVTRLAGLMAKDGAEAVAKLLPGVEQRVGLDPVKELGFLLFHEAEKKSDTKDAILFNGLVGAWGDLREQARKHSEEPEPGFQMTFDFDEQGDS